MKSRIVTAFFALLLLAMAGLAQHPPPQPPPPPGAPQVPPPPAIVAGFLGFSDEQATQFRQLLEAREQAAHDLAEQAAARQRALEELLNASAPDPAAIGRLMLELRSFQRQFGQITSSFRERFLALLTSEQREKLGQVERAAQLMPAVSAFVGLQLIEPPRFP